MGYMDIRFDTDSQTEWENDQKARLQKQVQDFIDNVIDEIDRENAKKILEPDDSP